MNRIFQLSFILLCLFWFSETRAHEIRPAYLEIVEQQSGEFLIKWKVPILNQRIPNIYPEFDNCTLEEQGVIQGIEAFTKNYVMNCSREIGGSLVEIINLERTLIDVILRVERTSGEMQTLMIQPDRPYVVIPTESSSFQVMKTFGILGVEHILFGWDHLLFVLGLMLLIRRAKLLLATVTAFTVSHSITLALSSLGQVSLPSAPVETVIALSVIFLAREYLTLQKGEETYTSQYPWTVAFIFGLLHGFGFAGALSEIGLPEHALAASLLAFNLGVELGQLLFILMIYVLYQLVRSMVNHSMMLNVQKKAAYFIGSVAAFWFIERLYGILL